MATVTTPKAIDVARRCGLDKYAEGWDDNSQFYASIDEFIEDGEAETALAVTEAVYDSATLTARQARALEVAVSCRAAAGWLLSPHGFTRGRGGWNRRWRPGRKTRPSRCLRRRLPALATARPTARRLSGTC
jgi:hypothetical protein